MSSASDEDSQRLSGRVCASDSNDSRHPLIRIEVFPESRRCSNDLGIIRKRQLDFLRQVAEHAILADKGDQLSQALASVIDVSRSISVSRHRDASADNSF